MTIRFITTRTVFALTIALAYVALSPATPAAADREHQQIMADLRMLQEQTNQLQALMNTLGEALKAVNSRLDDQTTLERKSFADGRVQMDTMSSDLRVVREKVDEANVRLGSLSQELESLRQAIPEPGAVPVPPVTAGAGTPGAVPVPPTAGAATPGAVTDTPAPPAATTTPTTNPGISAQRAFDGAFGDYAVGNYSLAIQGFEQYLQYFPKSLRAHEAQLYIGESLFLDKKNAEAVAAYERVIANYPSSPSVPQAYYKRGLALQGIGQNDKARESFETVIKQFPDSPQATLAKQRIEPANRPAAR
jgi:tol-pal system protein YbgF